MICPARCGRVEQDDLSDDAEDRIRRYQRRPGAAAGPVRRPVRQLAGQAVQHGSTRLGVREVDLLRLRDLDPGL